MGRDRMTARYVAYVLLLIGAGAVAAWWMKGSLPPGALQGAWLGLALSGAGAISWIVAAAATMERGPRAFMAALALGILGRLVVYGATLVYVLLRTTLDPIWTAGSLMGSYAVFLVLEVRFALLLRGLQPGGSKGERS
jgi:hypothetical protein